MAPSGVEKSAFASCVPQPTAQKKKARTRAILFILVLPNDSATASRGRWIANRAVTESFAAAFGYAAWVSSANLNVLTICSQSGNSAACSPHEQVYVT